MVRIAPSILAADFSRLGEQVAQVESAGADRIHVDVMDGHFVPNLSMGPVVVSGLRPRTKLALEVHLMVEDPGRFLDAWNGFLRLERAEYFEERQAILTRHYRRIVPRGFGAQNQQAAVAKPVRQQSE